MNFRLQVFQRLPLGSAGIALVGVCLLVFQNCDEVRLSVRPQTLSVASKGMICAQQPKTVEQDRRFVFMIDNSGSMQGIDPGLTTRRTLRVSALRAFVEKFKGDSKFAISVGSLYGGQAGFLPDPTNPVPPTMPHGQPGCTFYKPSVASEYAELSTALNQLDIQATPAFGTSPFMNLLDSYQTCLQADLPQNRGALYSLVLVTDGAPTDAPLATLQAKIAQLVAAGKAAGAKTSSVNLYLLFMDPSNASTDAANVAAGMVKAAQDAGGLRSKSLMLDPSNPIDFSVLNLVDIPHFRLSQLIVSNLNAGIEENGEIGADSDADGLADKREISLGLKPDNYSSHDMCSDLVYTKNGGHCPSTCPQGFRFLDTDHDGLSDCDEMIIGTSPTDPDSDGDGIPDGLEYVLGMSPNDGTDRALDPDGDGVQNFAEAARFTSPSIDDRGLAHKTLIDVSTQEQMQADGTYCYNVSIKGIPLFPTSSVTENTLAQLNHAKDENIVRILFMEVPENQPSAKPVVLEAYRVLKYNAADDGMLSTLNDLNDMDFSFVNP